MKRHVSLVVVPIDDVTSQVISGNYIRPFIDWEKEAIWKPGYYVFMDVGQKEPMIQIESRLYQSQNVLVSLDEEKTKIVKVHMAPSELYRKAVSYQIVRGTGRPGETVGVYSEYCIQHFKLLKDFHRGEQIGIYNSTGLELSGRKLWIKGREKNWFLRLGELSEEADGWYEVRQMDLEEKESIRKVEATVFLVYETTIREDGSFYLLIPRGEEKEYQAVICYQEKETKISFLAEEENDIELEEE